MSPSGTKRARPDLAARNRGPGIKLYEDAAWCRRKYFDEDLTYREIAREASCSLRTIARWFAIHGIEVPDSSARRQQRGTQVRGEKHWNWQGGPEKCSCGAAKSFSSRNCQRCHFESNHGEGNPKWAGDDVGYPGAHERVKSIHGSASRHTCKECGGQAAHWAYDHRDPDEKHDPDQGYYSPDPSHYMPMCAKCHKRFDMKRIAARRARVPAAD